AVGIGDSQTGDAPGNNVFVSGTLGVSWGADNSDTPDGASQDGASTTLSGRNVVFTNNAVLINGTSSLTSHGEAVTFVLSENGTKLVGMAGAREVLEVKLFDDGSGHYEFTLKDHLDHAPNGDENDITLAFSYTAHDSDGDAATGTFIVGIDDDMPVL